jgi:hypothetical protein
MSKELVENLGAGKMIELGFMLASNSLGAVDERVLNERLHVVLDVLKSDSETGLSLAVHGKTGIEESF